MRIGIDARSLVRGKRGVGHYLYNVIINLREIDPINEYFLYSHKDFVLPFSDPRFKKRIGTGLAASIGTVWFQSQGLFYVLSDKLDVFWGTQCVLPYGLPSKLKKILTIYDLVYLLYSSTMNKWNTIVYKLFSRFSIDQVDVIATISDAVAEELRALLADKRINIRRIYCGVDPQRFHKIDMFNARDYVANKYQISDEYMLAVGTLEPRKNLGTLIKAFAELKTRKPAFKQKLVIVGAKGWKYSSLFHLVRSSGQEESILFLGYVPDDDLPYLYSASRLFISPSIYEGFGMPVLEALMSGATVLLSDIKVFHEIAGSAATYFEPTNVAQLTDKIVELLSCQKMIGDPKIDFAQYSWQKAAHAYLECFMGTG